MLRFEEWKQHVRSASGRVVVLELGCGDQEPVTARREAETLVAELNRPAVTAAESMKGEGGAWQAANARASLVRVNATAPAADDPTLLHGSEVVSLLTSCAAAIELLVRKQPTVLAPPARPS